MPDDPEAPVASGRDGGRLAPGVRAARERLGLTQEEVAERLNVSVHTFRKWDQNRTRPNSPEKTQLMATVLRTPISVLWPPGEDPHVAHATPAPDPAAGSAAPGEAPPVPPEHTPEDTDAVNVSSSPDERWGQPMPGPDVDAANSWSPSRYAGDDGDIPPASGVVEAQVSHRAGSPGPGRAEGHDDLAFYADAVFAGGGDESVPADAAQGGVMTLGPDRRRRSGLRVAVAAVAAGVLGVGAITFVTTISGSSDPDHSTTTTTDRAARTPDAQQRAAAVRRERMGRMLADAARGDYDAAIALARQLNDPAAVKQYQHEAGTVLVRRADKAARRGDLPLARSRLQQAGRRYGTAPGAAAVRATIRRIERQRATRAKRQRAEARAAAARRAAAAARTPSSPAPSPSTPVPPAGTSQPAAPQRSQSESSKPPAKRRTEPEEAVDPGLF